MSDTPHFRSNSAPRSAPTGFPIWLGWIVAAVALPLAFFMASRLMTLGTEVSLARTEAELARAEAQSLGQLLEAERIITTQQIADLQAAQVFGETVLVKLTPPAPSTAQTASAPLAPSAVWVWHAANREGIVWAEQLPLPKPDEEYRVWLAAANSDWVSAGALAPATAGGLSKTIFRIASPFTFTRILVTREVRQNPPAQPAGEPVLAGDL